MNLFTGVFESFSSNLTKKFCGYAYTLLPEYLVQASVSYKCIQLRWKFHHPSSIVTKKESFSFKPLVLGALLLYHLKRIFSESVNWERHCNSIPCTFHIFFLNPLWDLLYETENLLTVSDSSSSLDMSREISIFSVF